MKRATLLILVLALFACGEKEQPKPLSEPGETLYTVRGVVLSRNAADNSLKVDHEPIPGFMEAMIMDYTVRGADVATLPPDKSRIEAKLHVTSRAYWITDVKQIP
ncbi:MAG TPA: copper-binding protein [Thermoanaerobaculia bacterium]|nr:copper-binding protein [Thermoanaerobaculia bacterium]